MAKIPIIEEMGRQVGEYVLNEFEVDGKTLREWIDIVKAYLSNGWISVKDRLPENPQERVLVKTHSDCVVGNPKVDTDRYMAGMWVRYGGHVTHWMPLPEPPKEG